MTQDLRAVLKAYMSHVLVEEGVTFVDGMAEIVNGKPLYAAGIVSALREVEKEVEEELLKTSEGSFW